MDDVRPPPPVTPSFSSREVAAKSNFDIVQSTITKEVVFIRHAQSLGQIALGGDRKSSSALIDCDLSREGYEQARRLRRRLLRHVQTMLEEEKGGKLPLSKYDRVLVLASPLKRSLMTALTIFHDESAREGDNNTKVTISSGSLRGRRKEADEATSPAGVSGGVPLSLRDHYISRIVVHPALRELSTHRKPIPENISRSHEEMRRDEDLRRLGYGSSPLVEHDAYERHCLLETGRASSSSSAATTASSSSPPQRGDYKMEFFRALASRPESRVVVVSHSNWIADVCSAWGEMSVDNCAPIHAKIVMEVRSSASLVRRPAGNGVDVDEEEEEEEDQITFKVEDVVVEVKSGRSYHAWFCAY